MIAETGYGMSATQTKTISKPRTASPRCRLCRTFKRYNEKTQAAIREADGIMREIVSGKRKPKTLDAMLAEIAAI